MAQNIFASLYLRLYRLVLSVSLGHLARDPAPDELTARYLTQSGHYASSAGRVKPRAFHPARRDHKTSVFRVQGLTEHQVWRVGDVYVALPLGGEVLARAELSVAQIADAGLRLESAEPPLRHANIVEWPPEKDAWMSRAQELAAVATLRLRVRS